MDKRDFLKGMLATAFVAAIPFKAIAKNTTSVSPPIRREFQRYDSVALAYIKDVLGRTPPVSRVGMKTGDRFTVTNRLASNYADLVPPDPVKSALLLEHHREAQGYFALLPKAQLRRFPIS